MALKLRISTATGKHVSATSTTEELLDVLIDYQRGTIMLNQDEEDTLRGWLLMHADALKNGEIAGLNNDKTICIGKTAEGRPFVRDLNGDWPPPRPNF